MNLDQLTLGQILRWVDERIRQAILQYQRGGGGGNPTQGGGFYTLLSNGVPVPVYPDGIPDAGSEVYAAHGDHAHEFYGIGWYQEGLAYGNYRRADFHAGTNVTLSLADEPSFGAIGVTIAASGGGSGTPGGLDKNVQYNNGGSAFGGVLNNATATKKYLQQVSSGTPSLEQVDYDDLVNLDNKTSKATPVDSDEILLADSAASFATKKLTWANLKATLKTYFDGLYAVLSHTHSGSGSTGVDVNLALMNLLGWA